MDFLEVQISGISCLNTALKRWRLTSDIIRQLEWGHPFGNIYVKHIIIFFAFIQLFATLADGINDLADLLPSG